jgi:hypothetical protein
MDDTTQTSNADARSAGADPLAALKAQFAAQAGDNPALAMLLQFMEQRTPAPARDDGPPAPSVREEQLQADLDVLVRGHAQQAAELDRLRQRNDTLAAALGACHLCFGDDAWCPRCGGRGGPASRRPDPAAFAHFVRPLLAKLQARDAGRAAPPRTGAAAPPDSAEGLRAASA